MLDKRNREQIENEAMISGLIGMVAAFFVLKDYIFKENTLLLVSLTVVFVFCSLLWTFGIILGSSGAKTVSKWIFRWFVVSFSIFTGIRILFTEYIKILDIFIPQNPMIAQSSTQIYLTLFPLIITIIYLLFEIRKRYGFVLQLQIKKKIPKKKQV